MKKVKIHLRRIALEVLALIFQHDLVFRLLGKINRRFGIIKTVFVMYPAQEKYAAAYVYEWRRKKIKWTPKIAGFFAQNGKFGLIFMILAVEKEFRDPNHLDDLKGMVAKVERIRMMLGAESKSFSGVLPGLMHKYDVLHDTTEADITVKSVVNAIGKVMKKERVPEWTHVCILGGGGYIGRRVVAALPKEVVSSVDLKKDSVESHIPTLEAGEPMVLVNIATATALSERLDEIMPGTIVLNEAYPEPSEDSVKALINKGCVVYHIAGVKAKSIPSFPYVYHGGIPCCAAWNSSDIAVNIVRLS